MQDSDRKFLDRADQYIDMANQQLGSSTPGEVSASMMYGTARFNAWFSAMGFDKGEEMEKAKPEILKYFLGEYEKMLKENLDDYIRNFAEFMK